MIPSKDVNIHVADHGAWSSKGKRKAQEDAFGEFRTNLEQYISKGSHLTIASILVLHEIHDTKDRSVLVAGVMDGHGGTSASAKVSEELPSLLTNQLIVNRRSVPEALEDSWEIICNSYRQQCENEEACSADYDPREGILMAKPINK